MKNMSKLSPQLDHKAKGSKLEPQTKEEALANIKRLRNDLGLDNIKANGKDIKRILKRTGSLSEEAVKMRHEQDKP